MGKSGITRCIIHKDIHKTVDSPAFQRWKMWITRLCIVEKWGKTPSYILWTAIKLPTRYRRYPHSSTIIHELSTSSKCRDYRIGIVQATSSANRCDGQSAAGDVLHNRRTAPARRRYA